MGPRFLKAHTNKGYKTLLLLFLFRSTDTPIAIDTQNQKHIDTNPKTMFDFAKVGLPNNEVAI